MARKKQPHEYKFSEESRKRMSLAQTGKTVSAETRAKLSAARKGVPRSPEACAAISAGKLGKKRSPEECAAIREGMRKRRERLARENKFPAYMSVLLMQKDKQKKGKGRN